MQNVKRAAQGVLAEEALSAHVTPALKKGGEHFKLLHVNFGTLLHHILKRPTCPLRPLKRNYLVTFLTHTKKLTILLSKDLQ